MALPRGVHQVRAGGRVYYYWQPGRGTERVSQRERIPGDPTDPAFWSFLEAKGADVGSADGTVARAFEQWQASPDWKALAVTTRRDYDRYVDQALERWGDDPVPLVTRARILEWRRELADRPVTANHMVSVMRSFFDWCVSEQLAAENPAAGIRAHKVKHEQAPPWPEWALELIRRHARWEVRAAIFIMRYTGQREADAVAMTLRHFSGGRISVMQQKTGTRLSIPVHPDLDWVPEEARARGSIALFPMRDGQPMSADAWRSMYYRDLDRAPELKPVRDAGLSGHGCRALATNELLEVGCTSAEVSGITGMSMQQIERYAIARNRARLADRAMAKWTGEDR